MINNGRHYVHELISCLSLVLNFGHFFAVLLLQQQENAAYPNVLLIRGHHVYIRC